MSIDQFRSKLGAGGTRPNQFRVSLTFPALVGGGAADDSILVTSASLPASNVDPTIVQYRGREVKFAGERIFDPWNITIINDTTMKLRKQFERWSNLMNNYETNGGSTVPATYYADIQVTQLDRNDAEIRSYVLYNAFPITVGEVALSYGMNNTISEFNIQLQYSHFQTDPF